MLIEGTSQEIYIYTVELGFKGRQDKRKLDFKRQIASDQLFM